MPESQRRGKIARLPRSIRDQLNIRLDDGLEAAQILPWLNALPEVRDVLARLFNGSAISSQNLSAWRQGGFQEWLFQQQFLATAAHMRENVEELHEVVNANNHDVVENKLVDYMVTQLTVRFGAFLATWDGGAPSGESALLLKMGHFILRIQQATYKAERQALDNRNLRRQARAQEESDLSRRAYMDYCLQQSNAQAGEQSQPEAKPEKAVKQKPGARPLDADSQSRSIKPDKASHEYQISKQEPADSPDLRRIESRPRNGVTE